MGLENFNPNIWSAKLFVRLRKILVHAGVVNREYEGEISAYGDTVYINEIGAINIGDYTKNGETSRQRLNGAQKALIIDNAKYFDFAVSDIDMVQNHPKVMDGAMSEAAYAIGDTVDQHLAGLYTQAGNSVDALTVTVGNVLQNLSNLQLKLDEANVPNEGRFLPVPPWYNQHLVMATSGAVSATGVPKVFDDGMIVSGFVGNLFGFNLLMSNNVNNNGTVWNLMGFNRSAITHAQQLAKIEAYRTEKGFDDGVKGLYLYGSKVVRPAAMVKCAATKG
jgi:hypothetical protein